MMLMAGTDKSVAFGKYPARVGKYEVWSDVVAPDAMQAMLAASRLQMGEGTPDAEGKTRACDIRDRYAWPRRIMDAAPVVVPGKHHPACGGDFQSQRASRNSGRHRCSRDAGEVSARRAIEGRACNCMQLH